MEAAPRLKTGSESESNRRGDSSFHIVSVLVFRAMNQFHDGSSLMGRRNVLHYKLGCGIIVDYGSRSMEVYGNHGARCLIGAKWKYESKSGIRLGVGCSIPRCIDL